MNIKEIVLYVTETRTYEIVFSEENGYDMPENANELVEYVNNVRSSPHLSDESLIHSSIKVTDYDIKENK